MIFWHVPIVGLKKYKIFFLKFRSAKKDEVEMLMLQILVTLRSTTRPWIWGILRVGLLWLASSASNNIQSCSTERESSR